MMYLILLSVDDRRVCRRVYSIENLTLSKLLHLFETLHYDYFIEFCLVPSRREALLRRCSNVIVGGSWVFLTFDFSDLEKAISFAVEKDSIVCYVEGQKSSETKKFILRRSILSCSLEGCSLKNFSLCLYDKLISSILENEIK